ncbi:rhomboid family intramembrane serine protease [Alkalihalobacillus sp. 1P02AB]|uniref:rhomboid family intramembrane serine protease n=1 Tax=Alkalihalobacillus sp. 1P02AB TaxID=3132260 RepID=UPI0039A67EB6
MDSLRHDYRFWSLVHDLVFRKNCQLLFHKGEEVWLEDDSVKPTRIFRIVRKDLDWANRYKEEMIATAKKMELIRRERRLREVQAENIYVTVLPPVDDYSSLTSPLYVGKKKKTVVHTSFIFQDEETKGAILSERLLQSGFLLSNLPVDVELEPMQLDAKIVTLKYELKLYADKKKKEEKELFSFGKPFITYALLVMNVFIFILIELYGDSESILTLVEVGAKYSPLILDGEWWRIITSMFIHIGFLHLLMNSLALYFLGTLVERIYGSFRFVFIYFIAGVLGTLISFWMNLSIGAGASGAIFGLFGALLYFGLNHRKLFFQTMGANVLIVLVINLAFGFLIPVVDNSAHVGGLIGGFLAAYFIQLPKQKKSVKQLIAVAILFSMSLVPFLFADALLQKDEFDLLEAQIAYLYIEEEKLAEAYTFLERPYARGTDVGEIYFYLGYLKIKDEEIPEAKVLFEQALEKNPNLHPAYFNLSLIVEAEGDYDKALEYIQKAIELNPDREEQYSERLKELETR